MKKLYFALVLILVIASSYGQKITMVKTFGGVRFETDSLSYSPKQVLDIVRDDQLAYMEFKQAKSNYNAAGILGFVGGFMVGFPIGSALFGGDPEWGLAAGGAALIIASIPLNNAFKRHAQGALDIYNKDFTSSRKKVRADLSLLGVGARLTIKF